MSRECRQRLWSPGSHCRVSCHLPSALGPISLAYLCGLVRGFSQHFDEVSPRHEVVALVVELELWTCQLPVIE